MTKVDLFAGSVLENIALGEFQPDIERILKLARVVGALNFINDLSGGLNSQLGENGVNLSGGQKQRLAILRALYPGPEIIIFDEATSALDNQSEKMIINTMRKLKAAGKTVIAITHRPGPAIAADRVILLEKGKIIADGGHYELNYTSKTYQNYWKEATYQPVGPPLEEGS